ncbi:MAG TPA: sulfur oxidation c-type cytochrome SoxA [Burkholderiales bacterium]|nr:sulfur oxidation c-type cytochrome SoxA [Burkholderiales bacterium]
MKKFLGFCVVVGGAFCASLLAQDAKKEIQRYRQMVAEGSPVELFEIEGQTLWNKPQGPKNVSLEQCDLGLGPGVVKGAYARLPRYFKDADRVMDLETRLLHCMMTLQGRTREEATRRVFGNADRPSEMESLSAYIAAQSRGVRMSPGTTHPKEKQAYELGRALYFHRAGTWDFSCASCHGEEGKRIRMQDLPVLYKPEHARPVVSTWPAYRVSTSQFITLQWRMNNCYQQMRMPEPDFGSDTTVALILFLTATGKGEPYRGPGNKR